MISAGENPDLVLQDFIDQPIGVIDTAGPAAGKVVLQGFGLAGALERVTLHFLDQLDDAESFLAVLLNPPGQILEGCRVKFQVFHRPPQAVSPGHVSWQLKGVPSWPRS